MTSKVSRARPSSACRWGWGSRRDDVIRQAGARPLRRQTARLYPFPRSSLTYRPGIPIIPLGISPRPTSRGRGVPDHDPPRAAARAAIGAAMTTTRDLVKDERDQFAFHDDIVYLRETKRGLTRETVEEISGFKDEPDVDARVPAAGVRPLPEAARCRPGAGGSTTSTSTRSSTTASRPSARRSPGTTSRSRSRRRSRSSASPRRSASSWPASAPSTTPRSCTTRCARS